MKLRRTTRPKRGISLLEVLAALVILSVGASVAFTWLGNSASHLSKLKEEEAGLLVQNEILQYLRAINPTATPTGELELSGHQVSWSSTPIAATIRATNPLGTLSRYEVTLYQMDIDVRKAKSASEPVWIHFQLRQAGYKQVAGKSTGIF